MELNEPVRIYDKSVEIRGGPGYADSFASFRMQVRTGDLVIPAIPSGAPLDAECNHFLDCIEGKVKAINDGMCGLRVVRTLEAASQSMRTRSVLTDNREETRVAAGGVMPCWQLS